MGDIREPSLRRLGLSQDGRTNLWEVTCRCGYSFRPGSTLRRYQHVQCSVCGEEYMIDYNEMTVTAMEDAG